MAYFCKWVKSTESYLSIPLKSMTFKYLHFFKLHYYVQMIVLPLQLNPNQLSSAKIAMPTGAHAAFYSGGQLWRGPHNKMFPYFKAELVLKRTLMCECCVGIEK